MPIIHVLQPGFQTTFQDLGRFGHAHLGISASGAADAFSMRVGNLLVGNAENSSALEMTLTGGEFQFEDSCIVALTGSDFEPKLNGESAPLWHSFKVPAGGRLRLGSTKNGARCYLCVGGGFEVPSILGSRSTQLLTNLGGMNGRALKRSDVLQAKNFPAENLKPIATESYLVTAASYQGEIRVTEGMQADCFSSLELEKFYSAQYIISEDSNRMGLRLASPKLTHLGNPEIITEGAPLGAIQIPPSGEPIILFVEHQTTGGYPKIANVISADMHFVGQLRPRDEVRFRKISLEEAYSQLREQERLIQSLRDLTQ